MLLCNTTYHIDARCLSDFLAWLTGRYIPEVIAAGILKSPKLLKILSNNDCSSASYSLQWEVDSSKALHNWFIKQGKALGDEMAKTFDDGVASFTTLLETVELPEYDQG